MGRTGVISQAERIEGSILVIRGREVMLDMDLATLYRVSTRALNQQVKRNRWRFPKDFVFRLTSKERDHIAENHLDIWERVRFSRHPTYAFTEHGAAMVSSVLRNRIAADVAIGVLRAFRERRAHEHQPVSSDDAARVVHGLFAAIRDAVLLQREDRAFITDEPYTYFVQAGDGGPIKIGWTRNLAVRLRTFATMWPVPLKLLGVIRGNVEDQCHRRFAASRLGGEWFSSSEDVLDFIRDRAITPAKAADPHPGVASWRSE